MKFDTDACTIVRINPAPINVSQNTSLMQVSKAYRVFLTHCCRGMKLSSGTLTGRLDVASILIVRYVYVGRCSSGVRGKYVKTMKCTAILSSCGCGKVMRTMKWVVMLSSCSCVMRQVMRTIKRTTFLSSCDYVTRMVVRTMKGTAILSNCRCVVIKWTVMLSSCNCEVEKVIRTINRTAMLSSCSSLTRNMMMKWIAIMSSCSCVVENFFVVPEISHESGNRGRHRRG